MEKQATTVAEAGRRGGKARLHTLSPERRRQIAQQASAARWGKIKPIADVKPGRFWCLYGFAGGDPLQLKILFSSRRREEVRAFARALPEERSAFIDFVDYDPGSFSIERKYQPDAGKQVEALQTLLKGGQS